MGIRHKVLCPLLLIYLARKSKGVKRKVKFSINYIHRGVLK